MTTGRPVKRLAHRVAHEMLAVPASVGLHDVTRLFLREPGFAGWLASASVTAVSVGALRFVTHLAGHLDKGGGARRVAIARLTYPPSILLTAGILYIPGRIAWTVARLLGARPLSRAKAAALGVIPVAGAVWAAGVGPRRVRFPRVPVKVKDLPAAFEGLRIAHLSDLHLGPFYSPARLEKLCAQVQALEPDLIVVTGDIVNALPEEAVLAGELLAKLKAPLGTFAILGNHDRYVDGDAVAANLEAAGLRVLKNEGLRLEKGGEALWLCGVDDMWTRRCDLDAALAQRPPGMPTLLLAHDPALFEDAARRGVDLTLSGHTHGGQLAVPYLRQLGMARAFTRHVAGFYRLQGSALYVSRGSGVVVPPIRFGAPPEVPVIVLERALPQDVGVRDRVGAPLALPEPTA